jgi:hypothetical protein
MSLEGKDFFRQLEPEPEPEPPPPPPKLPFCVECEERANPNWGFKNKTYCRDCAPAELTNPSLHFREVE